MVKLLKNKKTNKRNNRKINKKTNKKTSNKIRLYKGGNIKSSVILLEICKQACDIMKPMIEAFYNIMSGKITNIKPDKTIFTIVDGLVQYFLKDILFKDKFQGIVGEENVIVNIDTGTYTVDDIPIPNEIIDKDTNLNSYQLIDQTKTAIQKLRLSMNPSISYRDKYVFIDPIDGTSEFSKGLGQQSTILIGFSDSNGNAWAGIIYRPISPTATSMYKYQYVYGCRAEEVLTYSKISTGYIDKPININSLLTSNKDISTFLEEIVNPTSSDGTETKLTRVKSGGAGNKMLMVLEGEGEAYIQDRGLNRWDTCAPEAVIKAAGGFFCKLTDFLKNGDKSYTYKVSDLNLDFEPASTNNPKFSLHNISTELNEQLNAELPQIKIKLMAAEYNAKHNITNNKLISNKLNKLKNNEKNYPQILKEITNNFLQKLNSNKDNYTIENFTPYFNLSGVVAFLNNNPDNVIKMRAICKTAEEKSLPIYA